MNAGNLPGAIPYARLYGSIGIKKGGERSSEKGGPEGREGKLVNIWYSLNMSGMRVRKITVVELSPT